MKRLLFLLAIASLALPAAAIAKGPSEASITGPGLGKAITIVGAEVEGSPLMSFAEQTGFFPAAFGQQPDPMLPAQPKGDLGPKYRIEYKVPGGNNDTFQIKQDLYPYASPSALTYTAPGQKIFDSTTQGGWFESPLLKDTLVAAGLPKNAAAAKTQSSSAAGFSATGWLAVVIGIALLIGAAAWFYMRRQPRNAPA
jgi:hypothetical protein